MSQHDMNIANQSRTNFRTDLNNALAALVSQNSGATEPSTTFAYQLWADTTNGYLKMRNAANSAWIQLWKLSDMSASATEKGIVELLTNAEGETGTDDARTMTAAVNAYINQRGQQLYSASSGTNTYTATLAPAPAALVHGMQINIKFGNASTAAATLNLNSLGAKKIYIESSGAYAQVGSGNIFAGMNASLSYDSALDSSSGGWVIKNAPLLTYDKARGYCSGVTLVNGVSTKVPINVETYDVGGILDSANGKFIPLRAGYYQVNWNVKMTQDSVDTAYIESYAYKNGVVISTGIKGNAAGTQAISSHGSDLIYFNGSTDYLELYALQNAGSNKAAGADSTHTFMSIVGPF